MNRSEAFQLLKEYTKKEGLIKHALAVEAAMKWYAKKLDGDVESWGIVGLLHDFDYEKYPDLKDHPFKGARILREKGVEEAWINAILSHAEYSGVKRESSMEKTLFAVDELSGFIVAVSLVRPSKKIADVSIKSVKKKMKDKAFAAAVNREDIEKAADELGIPLEDHISNVLDAMKSIADQLGL